MIHDIALAFILSIFIFAVAMAVVQVVDYVIRPEWRMRKV